MRLLRTIHLSIYISIKTRTNVFLFSPTEEVAALVIDNGYVVCCALAWLVVVFVVLARTTSGGPLVSLATPTDCSLPLCPRTMPAPVKCP